MHRRAESSEGKGSKQSEMETTPEAVGRSTESAAGEPTTRLVCPFAALEHLATIGRVFNDFYQHDKFTDVRIETSSGIIRAHLNVLAAHSGVFQRKAREDPDLPLTVRTPDSFNGDDVKLAIDYVYAGEVSVPTKRIHHLLKVAEALELAELMKLCEQHLPQKSPVNGGPTPEKVIDMLAQRFASLSDEELTALTIDDICQLLRFDQLNAPSPVHVYRAAVAWLIGHPESEHLAGRIFDCIDFSLLPEEVLEATIEKSRASSGHFNSAVNQKATEALRVRRHGNRKNAKSSATQTPSPGGQEEQCEQRATEHICLLGIKARIPVELNGVPIAGFLDSAAERSIVTLSSLQKDAVINKSRRFRLAGSNGLPITTIGSTYVDLKLGQHTIKHECAVWDTPHAPAPVLIGIDILRNFNRIHLSVSDDRQLNVRFVEYDGRNREELYQLELNLVINSQQLISAILDSGSDVSLISQAAISRIQDATNEEHCHAATTRDSPFQKPILSANGLPLATAGLAQLCVQVEGHAIQHEFLVSEQISHSAILGIDFIAEFEEVIIDFQQCMNEIYKLRGPPFRLGVKFIPKMQPKPATPGPQQSILIHVPERVEFQQDGTALIALGNVSAQSVIYRCEPVDSTGLVISAAGMGTLASLSHVHVQALLRHHLVDPKKDVFELAIETAEIGDDGSQEQPQHELQAIWEKLDSSRIRKTVVKISGAAKSVPKAEPTNALEFDVKWVEWRGAESAVVCQKHNGPCPLLAITNVLLLRGQLKLAPGTNKLTGKELLTMLGNLLIESSKKDFVTISRANYEQNLQEALSMFPRLASGLDINVKFTGISDFEFTKEYLVFDLLRIPLYHGWLIEPEDKAIVEAVGCATYNELVDQIVNDQASSDEAARAKAVLAKKFLEESGSQLTHEGLSQLTSKLVDGEIAVLFRNNHFATIFKHDNEVFQLLSDQGYFSHQNMIWETLDIKGDTDIVDGHFRSVTTSKASPPLRRRDSDTFLVDEEYSTKQK